MIGWETRRPWEAVLVSFDDDADRGRPLGSVLVICYRLAQVDPWLFLVDAGDGLGQQVLNAGRGTTVAGQPTEEQMLEGNLVRRYWDTGGDSGGLSLDLADQAGGRWRIQASRSDAIVAGISPTREVSGVTFRFTRFS